VIEKRFQRGGSNWVNGTESTQGGRRNKLSLGEGEREPLCENGGVKNNLPTREIGGKFPTWGEWRKGDQRGGGRTVGLAERKRMAGYFQGGPEKIPDSTGLHAYLPGCR